MTSDLQPYSDAASTSYIHIVCTYQCSVSSKALCLSWAACWTYTAASLEPMSCAMVDNTSAATGMRCEMCAWTHQSYERQSTLCHTVIVAGTCIVTADTSEQLGRTFTHILDTAHDQCAAMDCKHGLRRINDMLMCHSIVCCHGCRIIKHSMNDVLVMQHRRSTWDLCLMDATSCVRVIECGIYGCVMLYAIARSQHIT